MTQIKIFQPETYPKNIVEVRNEIMNFSDDTKNEIIHEEYLRDYASSKLWDLDSEFGKIHNRLMNYMEGYNIVAYHNTRLLNPNKIVNNKEFDFQKKKTEVTAESILDGDAQSHNEELYV